MKLIASLFCHTPPPTGQPGAQGTLATCWNLAPEQLLTALHAAAGGLDPADVEPRLKQYGPNALEAQRKTSAFGLFLTQLKSPLVLILLGAAIVSAILGEWTDAIVVLAIVLGIRRFGANSGNMLSIARSLTC